MMDMFYTVQDNNFREIIPLVRMAFNHGVTWISITALRNWGTYTPEEYQQRAVHLPEHPNYAEFKEVITNHTLTKNRKIILDSFNPEYIWQQHTINPGALLSSDVLRREQKRG
jgi:hypothetical protein